MTVAFCPISQSVLRSHLLLFALLYFSTSYMVGEWQAGLFHGRNNRWYPSLHHRPDFCFQGQWENGILVQMSEHVVDKDENTGEGEVGEMTETGVVAGMVEVATARGRWHSAFSRTAKTLTTDFSRRMPSYTFEAATAVKIATFPLLRDPWESMYVFVAPSSEADANEGLFAKTALPANFPCAWYVV